MNFKRERLALEVAEAFTAGGKLLYLLVELMGTATRTVLAQLKSLCVILLVFVRRIIPLLALIAGKGDDYPGVAFLSHILL